MNLKPETNEAIKTAEQILLRYGYPEYVGLMNKPGIILAMEDYAEQKVQKALEGYHKTEWVSVEDRLPGYMDCVIIHTENGIVTESQHCGDGSFVTEPYTFNNVTHWMPLPPSPNQNTNL